MLQRGAHTNACLSVSFMIVIRWHIFLFFIKHLDSFVSFWMCLVLFFRDSSEIQDIEKDRIKEGLS